MSGGSLNYFYNELECHIGDFGDKELDDLVKDLASLFHDREWYLSCDIGKGSWVEARDAFKAKWFTDTGRQERIEKYLAEIKNDVFEMFGISEQFCKNCKYWEQDKREGYSAYGNCDFETNCLMHRSESCEKFEKRGQEDTK